MLRGNASAKEFILYESIHTKLKNGQNYAQKQAP